jgi:hypothetical protein
MQSFGWCLSIRRHIETGLKLALILALNLSILAYSINRPLRASSPDPLLSQKIENIAQQIVNTRPPDELSNVIGDKIGNVEQAIQQMITQVSKTSNQNYAELALENIARAASSDPKSPVSDSIWICATQISKGENIDLTGISPPPQNAVDRFVSVMISKSINDDNSAMNIRIASSAISNENQKAGRFVDQAAVSDVLKKIILQTTIKKGAIAGSQSLYDTVREVTANPLGSRSLSIASTAEKYQSGQIDLANHDVDALSGIDTGAGTNGNSLGSTPPDTNSGSHGITHNHNNNHNGGGHGGGSSGGSSGGGSSGGSSGGKSNKNGDNNSSHGGGGSSSGGPGGNNS